MSAWHIRYWTDQSGKNIFEEWLSNLSKQEAKIITKKIEKLEFYGNTLKMPHSKALGQGLFELREQVHYYRIYYGFHGKQIIIVLTAGNKKSQEKDIKIARKRLESLEGSI